MAGEERRRQIRLSTRLNATVTNVTTGAVQQALTKDISGAGVCLITDDMIDTGTPLSIAFHLPDLGTPVTFLGDVVWSMLILAPGGSTKNPPAETGIRYVSIDPKVRAAIVQYARMNALPPP